ncbi:MAG TPA: TIGR03435 family protein [Candidatus Solibacter sp.]
MIRGVVGVCFLAIAPLMAYAEGALVFEVASVKPAAPQAPGRFQISMGGDPGRINYTFVSLKNLIERAYSVKSYQVTGPDWMDSERFDVTAKLPDGAKQSDVPVMLQALLAERFKLTIHREQKSMPVYAIVVGKSGVKMPKVEGEALAAPGAGAIRMQMGMKGRQLAGKVTIDSLAGMLSRMLDRPVIDATELKDTYDMNLEWTPDDREGGMMGGIKMMASDHAPASEGSESSSAPSLFAAVQEQLGLKLDPRKGQVDVVVVDSVEKAPTQN